MEIITDTIKSPTKIVITNTGQRASHTYSEEGDFKDIERTKLKRP